MLVANLVSAVVMMTVGWYVQLVHYPSFRFIPEERFSEFHKHHSKWTGAIVLPAMLVEGVSAAALLTPQLHLLNILNALFAVMAIANTFIVFTPIHSALSKGKDNQVIDKLIRKNWPRTILWTAHSVAAIILTLRY